MISTGYFTCCGTQTLFFLHITEEPTFMHSQKEKWGSVLWNALMKYFLCFVCPPEILSMRLLVNSLFDSSRSYTPSCNLRLVSSWGIITILMSLILLSENICFNLLNSLLKLTVWRRKNKEEQIRSMTFLYFDGTNALVQRLQQTGVFSCSPNPLENWKMTPIY